ncbi:hypothetical protein BaRGS_00003868 [Batillaria attramentaria]|uniref:Phytanoyl-CoA dioxygenase n=1 Tax=Batillaria attramentaria TaxID=370345 RepID=A0ABD0M010_9CAEN
MLTSRHREELEEKGYTVVEGVLTEGECDQYRQQYLDWIRDNFHEGVFPATKRSLVRATYKMGHLAPTWDIRLKCKHVFAQLWGTDRLLTSFDSVAIGRPPEEGVEAFRSQDTSWLHIDQLAVGGLQVFQGAVYLEHADEDDWTFQVLKGSHKLFETFWKDHPEERERSVEKGEGSTKFTPDLVNWWISKGCQSCCVPVPKGGLVLWDSRTVHANDNPLKGRAHPERWRWVVIVSMWPVGMVDERGLAIRQQAYSNIVQTCHDLRVKDPEDLEIPPKHPLTELPEIAKTLEAKRLAGMEPYPPGKKMESQL